MVDRWAAGGAGTKNKKTQKNPKNPKKPRARKMRFKTMNGGGTGKPSRNNRYLDTGQILGCQALGGGQVGEARPPKASAMQQSGVHLS